MRLQDALRSEEETGTLELYGHRFWLSHVAEFASLQRAQEGVMGPAAKSIVYREGEVNGVAYVGMFRSVFRDSLEGKGPGAQLALLLRWLTILGYGRLQAREVHEAQGVVRIRLENSIEAESYGPSDVPICYSIAGCLGSLVGSVWGRPAACREERCAATNEPCCDFVVTVEDAE